MGFPDVRRMKLSYLLGVLMCAVGAISLYSAICGNGGPARIFSKTLLIVLGLAMILDPKKDNMRAIGIYALAIGLGRLARGFSYLGSESDITFIAGMVLVVLGGSLAFCGYSYFGGVSKNAYRMTVIAYFILMAHAVLIIYEIYMGADLADYFRRNYDTASFIVMYAAYILVLTSPEVTGNMPMELFLRGIGGVGSVSGISGSLGITESDLSRIEDGLKGASSWDAVDDGPVESETEIKLSGAESAFMVLQRWKGDEAVYVTMSADPGGTLVQASRFAVTDVVPEGGTIGECDHVRLYGPDGMVARLRIADRPGADA